MDKSEKKTESKWKATALAALKGLAMVAFSAAGIAVARAVIEKLDPEKLAGEEKADAGA